MSKLMELVQQYGDRIVGASLRDHKSEDDANKASRLLSEIRAAAAEMERDAARLQFMLSEQGIIAETYASGGVRLSRVEWPEREEWQAHWYKSDSEAIDAAMEAAK